MQNHFDIAIGAKLMSGSLQAFAQPRAIVDFSVADQRQVAGFISDWLSSALDIYDAQPPKAERNRVILVIRFIIRPAMCQRGRQPAHYLMPVFTKTASDTAHCFSN
jgi:hypothetical protein